MLLLVTVVSGHSFISLRTHLALESHKLLDPVAVGWEWECLWQFTHIAMGTV